MRFIIVRHIILWIIYSHIYCVNWIFTEQNSYSGHCSDLLKLMQENRKIKSELMFFYNGSRGLKLVNLSFPETTINISDNAEIDSNIQTIKILYTPISDNLQHVEILSLYDRLRLSLSDEEITKLVNISKKLAIDEDPFEIKPHSSHLSEDNAKVLYKWLTLIETSQFSRIGNNYDFVQYKKRLPIRLLEDRFIFDNLDHQYFSKYIYILETIRTNENQIFNGFNPQETKLISYLYCGKRKFHDAEVETLTETSRDEQHFFWQQQYRFDHIYLIKSTFDFPIPLEKVHRASKFVQTADDVFSSTFGNNDGVIVFPHHPRKLKEQNKDTPKNQAVQETTL